MPTLYTISVFNQKSLSCLPDIILINNTIIYIYNTIQVQTMRIVQLLHFYNTYNVHYYTQCKCHHCYNNTLLI